MQLVGRAVLCPPLPANQRIQVHHDGAHGVTRPTNLPVVIEKWYYESKGKVLTMAYHEVPPDVLEQPQGLVVWARRAIGIAASSKKPAKRAKRG